MKIFLVRHGIAEEREEFSKKNLDDHLRPLTDKGRRRMKEMVDWFKDYQDKVGLIVSSHLTRAVETAEILQKRYKHEKIEKVDWMAPSTSPDKTMRELQALIARTPQLQDLVLVGHEPHLSEFLSYSMTGGPRTRFEIKKGSITGIEIQMDKANPTATLLFMMQPKMLLD